MKILDSLLKVVGYERLNKEVIEELAEEDPEDAEEKIRANETSN